MASDLVRELVDSGIHYGHRSSRWNPKMGPYIFGKRNLIHIIDIRETVKGLIRAKKFLASVVAEHGDVLFVGTKRQAKYAIEDFAKKCGMPYVSERWLGGTLTNFRTVRSRLTRLEELENEEATGALQEFSKKAIATRTRERVKIKRNLDGIRNMDKLPAALIVVDVVREHNAVKEARKLHIPTVCLIDTDSDPQFADIPIPGNDDAIRSIEVVLKHCAEAIELGKRSQSVKKDDSGDKQQPKRRSSRVTARADDDGTGSVGADVSMDAADEKVRDAGAAGVMAGDSDAAVSSEAK